MLGEEGRILWISRLVEKQRQFLVSTICGMYERALWLLYIIVREYSIFKQMDCPTTCEKHLALQLLYSDLSAAQSLETLNILQLSREVQIAFLSPPASKHTRKSESSITRHRYIGTY